jgi:hypothetical protein
MKNDEIKDLQKFKERYIRIVFLPPATIAEINFFGESVMTGEENYIPKNGEPDFSENGKIIPSHFAAGLNAVDKLINDANLVKIKPDFKLYGFANCSQMEEYGPFYGFGRWLTIPDDMEVPFPFIKKQFIGGLYCAYSRPLPISGIDSDEWDVLNHFIQNNEKYQYDDKRGEPICNYGLLEDYLNYINIYDQPFEEKPPIQTDLLMPIKEK